MSILVPIIIDTDMQAVDCLWNHDGSILAVCGIRIGSGEKDSNVVIFYTPMGEVEHSILLKKRYNHSFLAFEDIENSW